jgi:hypothetical protein
MSNAMKINTNAVSCALMMLLLSERAAVCQPPQAPQPQLAMKRVIGIDYPWLARMAVLQGDVDLVATISTEGTVTRVRITSGAESLALSAKAALLKWQFTGCTSTHGECEARFVVSFVLNGSCDSEDCHSTFQVDFPGKITVTHKRITKVFTAATKTQDPLN